MSASAQALPDLTPARRTYYGWANVAVAALAMAGTLPGRTQGLGLITEPLLKDLQVDRVAYATINLWATVIGALFCMPCGRLVDRFGSRAVITVVLAALGGTVLAMAGASSWLALAAAITLSRGFGQSALSVVSLALVGKWFGRRLNYAMGVYAVLVGIGFIAAFPTVGGAVLSFGWRGAWSGVGWALLAVLTPVAWLITRDGPLNRRIEFDHETAGASSPNPDLTFLQALRSPAFWIFALSSSTFGLVYSGISLFNQSILEQRGFDAATYHTVLVLSTLLGLAANFAGGWVATWWPIQRLMGLGMAVLAAALISLPVVRTYTHVLWYAGAMGIAGGVVTVVFFSVWGKVYGRTHLGKIQGAAQMMTVFASAIGPLLLAETLRLTGSYDLIFYTLAAAVIILGIASWLVRLPTRTA
jgi:MFS family permease